MEWYDFSRSRGMDEMCAGGLWLESSSIYKACSPLSEAKEGMKHADVDYRPAKQGSVCVCVCVCVLTRIWLFATPGTVAARLLCPWDFPSKNTGVGCHFLLQGVFMTQGSSPCLQYCRQILYCWATREVKLGAGGGGHKVDFLLYWGQHPWPSNCSRADYIM